jgi:hypothetical protein
MPLGLRQIVRTGTVAVSRKPDDEVMHLSGAHIE